MAQETRVVLENMGKIDPESIDSYINAGGYEALAKARGTDRKALIDEIENAGRLRGRGGAGFNTGLKWSGAFSAPGDEKYIVCNADEGEPGTYKDRTIIENDPHRLLEGMLVAAYAVGANTCLIYCRGEYQRPIALLKKAIQDAEAKGITGGVAMQVRSGAGSYVCGEETALLESLEGKRGEPRLKPPFPTVAGYRGKPTVVNNVETFAAVPALVRNGSAWFASLGAEKYPGTKVFSLSGDIQRTGCFEAATDVTLKEVIEDFGGGPRPGHRIKAIQVGGSSSGFIKPEEMDISLAFDAMREKGSALGSGAILVIDETHNMVDLVLKMTEFYAEESCGKCVPCREGGYRAVQILRKFGQGKGTQKDLKQLRKLSGVMADACFCPLGQSTCTAAISALDLFPEDFEERMGED